jgi:hypothetical protein
MQSHPVRAFGVLLLLVGLLFPFSVRGETLTEYTTRVEKELEIPLNSIKGFNCEVGSEVLPTSQFGAACDSQALLHGPECTANSRLGVMSFSNPDVKGAWICRKYAGVDDPNSHLYDDIAMIVHNRKNGKTAFFQNDIHFAGHHSQGPIVPGPKDSNASDVWTDPKGVVQTIICTSCHLNDAFIVTPHVAKAFDAFGMTRFNPNGPYSVVASGSGETFASFAGFIKKDTGGCAGICHATPNPDFSADAQLPSKDWMPPEHRANYTPYHFNPIGGQFYVLRGNGEVHGLNGPGGGACNDGSDPKINKCPHWSVLGNHANTVQIAASSNKVFSRENSGDIREFTGVQCSGLNPFCPEWKLLDHQASLLQIASSGGQLFQLKSDGSIFRYTGTPCVVIKGPFGSDITLCLGWEKLDNNPDTIEIVGSNGNLYQRHRNGTVFKFTGTVCSSNSCPGWQMIANDSRTISLVAGGSALYMFQQQGAIWKFTGTPCSGNSCPGWQLVAADNNGATSQVAAGSGELYRLHRNGEIWRYLNFAQNWERIDAFSGNIQIEASINGLLVLHAQGDVWRFTKERVWIQIHNLTDTAAMVGSRP